MLDQNKMTGINLHFKMSFEFPSNNYYCFCQSRNVETESY